MNDLVLPQPFIDEDQPVLKFFPPRKYGILLPVLGLTVLYTVVLAFVGWQLLSTSNTSSPETSAAQHPQRRRRL